MWIELCFSLFISALYWRRSKLQAKLVDVIKQLIDPVKVDRCSLDLQSSEKGVVQLVIALNNVNVSISPLSFIGNSIENDGYIHNPFEFILPLAVSLFKKAIFSIVSLNCLKTFVELVLNIPARLLMAILAKYVILQASGITIQVYIDDNSVFLFRIDYIKFHFSIEEPRIFNSTKSQTGRLSQEKKFSVNTLVGPIYIGTENKESFGVTTPSLVIASCNIQPGKLRLKDVDLDFRLGKIMVNGNSCSDIVNMFQSIPKRTASTSSATKSGRVKWEEILDSISLTIPHINAIYSPYGYLVGSLDIHEIRTTVFTRKTKDLDQQPLGEIFANKIQLLLKQQDVTVGDISFPNLEIKASYVEKSIFFSSGEPRNDFVFITTVLKAPLVTIDAEQLSHILSEFNSVRTTQPLDLQEVEPFNISIYDMPACVFAVVLNSLRIELKNVHPNQSPDDCLTGIFSANNLIIRVSGEYIAKSRTGMVDIPSSFSSSSSSTLESIFAKQEYRWLNPNIGGSSSDSLLTSRGSKGSNNEWHNILGRVSRKKVLNTSYSFGDSSYQQWSYRWVGKIIFQKFDLGCNDRDNYSPFVYIKNTVLILRSRTNITLIQDFYSPRLQCTWTPENHIQAEAAVEKPVIYLWNAKKKINPFVFWTSIVPKQFENKKEKPKDKKNVSVTIKHILRNASISLDVSRGSIMVISVDSKMNSKTPLPPDGYIDNTPKLDAVSHIIFSTHKFAFVWESPEKKEIWKDSISLNGVWKSRCYMEKLSLQQFSWCENDLSVPKNSEMLPKKPHPILWVSKLNLSAKFISNHKKGAALPDVAVDIVFKVKKQGIQYSIRNHYACLLLVDSISNLKKQISSGDKQPEVKLNEVDQKQSVISVHRVSFQIERVDIHVLLPNDTQLYTRVDDLYIQIEPNGNQPIISLRNLMLLGVSPIQPGLWDQLVEIDKVNVNLQEATNIILVAKKIFVRIPYNYILAHVIDNAIGLVKAIKDLHLRLGTAGLAYTYFGPIPKNDPIMIPTVTLKTDIFTLHFDDDPFEAKLRKIWSTGKLEQERRLAYREAMDHKISEMYQEIKSTSPISSDSSLPSQVLSVAKLNELDDRIEQAEMDLLKYYSDSWIRHIKKTTQEESYFYHQLHIREDYRNPLIVKEMDTSLDADIGGSVEDFLLSNAFTIRILPRPLHPPLANFSAQFTKVTLRPADFPLYQTREFIYNIGKGVPLDTSFSIIIPFHLSIIAGETWVKLRDYPLPLLHVPANAESVPQGSNKYNSNKISWTLDGEYVLADDLGNSTGSRLVPIEIIPSSVYSSGYTLSAVRTASPLKFYSKIKYEVIPKGMSMVCWSLSYNPVIQDIIHILDRLTPPQVDPSPRIGFWDKVRLMIHSKIKILFSGGGDLAVVVKGTRNPYQLYENGKGLAKIWSDNVVWLLGYDNPQKEFMQIISDNYAFGVPDLIRGGYVPTFPDSLPYTLENIESNTDSKFSKVALKLSDGIRMGIGMDFERLSCSGTTCSECEKLLQPVHLIDRCRSQVFSPHYDVLFRSNNYVQSEYKDKIDEYDAFKGFRSNFIHLSFSIVKLQSDSQNCQDQYNVLSRNSMYLSPCFVEHFLNWFRMFGDPLSVPVREGKLFPSFDTSPSKKFGEHLNTIKYKICVNPLAIGYFCTEDEISLDTYIGGSAGLKAIVSSFSVDLHQRREIVRKIFNEKEPVKTEMNFHEIELQLQEIDLRAIRAEYSQEKKPLKTNYYVNQNEEYQCDEQSQNSESLDSHRWIDSNDFIMLASKSIFDNPSTFVKVHPFVFSPLFHYIRQDDEHGTERRRYLRDTHDCIMGRGFDTYESQKLFLQQRASHLDDIIETYDKELDNILLALSYNKIGKELNNQYESIRKQLEFLRGRRIMLHNYMGEIILESELSISDHKQPNGSPQSAASSTGRHILSRWETLMGHFKNRTAIHNPQIIWNTSVRDTLFYWESIRSNYKIRKYNLSTRCIKFLRDLVEKSQAHRQWQPAVPVFDDTFQYETASDKNMTDELIDKLLSERHTHFVAYNEKEEQKNEEAKSYNGIYVLEEDLDNVNDPDYQYKNIPRGYEMKSNSLFDMVHPQVNFQSDRGSGHLILLANERTQIKTFNIVDCENSVDTDVDLVKTRTIINLEKAQVLVAKRVQRNSMYLLSHNCYGHEANDRDHWATWTQPEQLWFFRKARFFDNFQCIAAQLSGNIQLDRHNPLRIKSNSTTQSQKNPFEDRNNTTYLHFPQVTLSLTSLEAHILYYSLANLVFGSERNLRKKERTEKLQDLMLAAERSDLAETVKQVGQLQKRARKWLDLDRRFKQRQSVLDAHASKEFKTNRQRLYENMERLDLIVEAIKSIQTFRTDIHLRETDIARKFIFNANEISWEMLLDDQSSLCKWTLSSTRLSVLQKANESSRKTIEIDKIHIKNTTESPVFVDVLDAYVNPKRNTPPNFSKHKMLYGLLDSLPPVGGIPVIQHFEVNLAPIHLQLSTAFGSAMKDYFFPQSRDKDLADIVRDDSSFLYFPLELDGEIEETQSDKISTMSKRSSSIFSFDMLSKKSKSNTKEKIKIKPDELSMMKTRSSTNRTFILVKISGAQHCLSLQGPKETTFYNLYNFSFKQPSLEYRNTTWSMAEMVDEIQRQMLLAILKHSPALFKKKLLNNKRQRASSTDSLGSSKSVGADYDTFIDSDACSINAKDARTDEASSSKSLSTFRLNLYNTDDEDDKSSEYYSKSIYSNDPRDDFRSVESLKFDKKSIRSSHSTKIKSKIVNQMDDLVAKGKLLLGKTYNGSMNASKK